MIIMTRDICLLSFTIPIHHLTVAYHMPCSFQFLGLYLLKTIKASIFGMLCTRHCLNDLHVLLHSIFQKQFQEVNRVITSLSQVRKHTEVDTLVRVIGRKIEQRVNQICLPSESTFKKYWGNDYVTLKLAYYSHKPHSCFSLNALVFWGHRCLSKTPLGFPIWGRSLFLIP